MKTTLILSTALSSLAFAAAAQEVNVVSWGGAYTVSQVEAYQKPFTEKTGIKVNSIDADNPATPLKAQVEAGNVSIDLADVELSDAIRLCDEGLLELIDPATLPAAPDGTPAAEDFVDGALQDCAVANIVWGTVIAYDTTKFTGEAPSTLNDFFDLEKFPGKRGLLKSAKRSSRMACRQMKSMMCSARLTASRVRSPSSTRSRIRLSGGMLAHSRRSFSRMAKSL